MSGNGGRRQVRQRTSKDAAYAKRLQDAGGGGGGGGADTTSAGGSNNNNEPTAAGLVSTTAGRKRQRPAPDNRAPSPTSTAAAATGSAASDSTKRPKRRGPAPEWACTACTLHNASRKRKCQACGAAKPTVTAATEGEAEAEAEAETSTAAALAPAIAVSSECASGDGGGKKRTRESNDEDDADADAPAAAATAADRTESTPSGRSRSSSMSSKSVSEWLRKMKQKKHQGGKGSRGGSKGDKRSSSRSKSGSGRGRGTGNGNSSSRSRSKSPIPPPTATAATATAAVAATAAVSNITENRHSDDKGHNRQDVKLVRVRVFDTCGGHGQGISGSGSSQQRRELSDSGPLEAKVAVSRPKLCATGEDIQEKDAAKELLVPPAEPFENVEVAPTDTTADVGKNDSAQAVANFTSSSDRAPELEEGENDNMAAEHEERKDDVSGSSALLEPVPIGGDGGNDEVPRASDSRFLEGDLAAKETRPSLAIDEESNVGVVPKDDADEPDPTNGMLNTKRDGASSTANASHLHPGVNVDAPLETNDIMPIHPTPANSPGMNEESLFAIIQDQSSTEEGSSENIIDSASTHVPCQPDPDETQATEEAGSMNTDQVKTGDVEHDQCQAYSYDLEVTDKVETGTKKAEASPCESGTVLSGRPAEEESVGSDEANDEELAADKKAVDPSSTTPIAETSRLEATHSSSSEIMAQSIGTEAQSQAQRDLSAPNEDESHEEVDMSQESNVNYDAFQPLTQAVPMFEYGYDLTQQQEEEFQQEPALSYPEEQVDANTTTTIADVGTGSDLGDEAENQGMQAVEKEQHVGSMASAEAEFVPTIAEKVSAVSECVPPQQLFESMPKAASISAVPLFSTGGGGSISISAEAMARATQMFEEPICNHGATDTSLPDLNQKPVASHAIAPGPASLFSTAGGSSILISAEAMKRAENIFSDPVQEQQTKEPKESALEGGLALFSTAGGKKIEVTDEALASASDIFDKEDQCKTIQPSSMLVPCPPSAKTKLSTKAKAPVENPGASVVHYGLGVATQSPSIAKNSHSIFSTAGKKREIVVDPQAVARANELLRLDENQGQPVPSSAMHALFSTAGKGVAIEVSEESLSKANQIFEGSNSDNAMGAQGATQMGPPSGAETLFSTAGGSFISVTADAVAKASHIFGDTVQEEPVAPSKPSPLAPSVTAPPSATALFSTAGGSSIAVSDDAITRAGQLFDNTEQIQHSPPLPPPPLPAAAAAPRAPASSATALFSTAGGASISISDDAMSKANQMFTKCLPGTGSDKDQSSSLSAPKAQTASTLTMGGLFSTAGGSSIAVSADAMSKANQIFAEPTNEAPSLPVAKSSASLFSTAGGASINVSDDALAKANQIFRMEVNKDACVDDLAPSSSVSATMPPPMFSTAGNNQVIAVSEQGLAKANEIFGGAHENEIQVPAIPAAAMFATAGQGTSITVSDDALAKANEMFAQNSSLDFPVSNQGEAKDTGGSARPRIHFAETPAQPAMRRRMNRSSLGGTAAKNVNIAQHMHPTETPLPAIARGGSAQALSTKKVLFREDNHQDRSQSYGDRESSGASTNASTTGPNVAIVSVTAATAAAAEFTPKHTPQVSRKPAAVTRSTIVRNPYAKRPGTGPDTSPTSSSLSAVTPVPFAFKHVEGTFSGRKFSPKTLERAAKILEEQPSSHSSRPSSGKPGYGGGMASASITSRRPRHLKMDGGSRGKMQLDGSDFHFSIDGTRLSLQEFDDIYGPMEDASHQACLDGGANSVLLKISSANAPKLRFDEQTGLPCAMFGAGNASGCKMVGNVQDLRRDLISKGCDQALLVDKWIINHFGWIIWKLACTERRYPQALAGKYLTYEHVLSQLKGRYDREIASAKRPALRIILNRDASAGRLMILCVTQIHRFRIKIGSDDPNSGQESNSPRPSSSKSFREELRLELTDGWYSIQAVLDSHLQSFIEQDKIKVGTKLLVAGAELAGSEDGVDPLDASYQPSRSSCPVALKLVANATRRAKWDSRLGFVKPTRQIQSHDGLLLIRTMGDVIPGGGSLPLMDLIICRRFPRSFLEKGPDGTSTILTEAQEERRRREFDERRHREMEKISEAAEKECTREVDEQAPEQWRKMMASNAMCDYYEGLSRDDKAIVDRWEERRSTMINDMTRRMIDAKMQSNVSLFRSSTPFLRITVKSLQDPPPQTCAADEDEDKERIIPNQPSATLTVWRMTEDQSNVLKEGTVIRIKDLAVKSELRDEMLQFSANDKTRMQALVQQPSSRQLQYSGFSRRCFAPIIRAHVLSRKASSSRKASGAHMDFAGVLVRSEHENHGMVYTSFSYFTDESGLLLRLQRDLDPNDESSLVGWNKALDLGQVLAFKDVLVLPFDSKANCAVVSWSQPTLQEKKGHFNDRRIKTLQRWIESEDAERTCSMVLASFDAGLPLYCRLPQRTEIAMGYILEIRFRDANVVAGNDYGGQYLSISNDHSFEVDIDCGGSSNIITATCSRAVLSQTIEMHLDPASHNGTALDLRDLLRQGGGNASGNLAPCNMTNLNLLFTESGVLFQVMLRKQTTSLEILQISPANVGALAALYLEALK